MASKNYNDVTEWHVGNPYTDIGEVLNSIIADIKSRQKDTDHNEEGKPGAVIYIPSGDYHLRTQVLIDISYLKIQGSEKICTSSSFFPHNITLLLEMPRLHPSALLRSVLTLRWRIRSRN